MATEQGKQLGPRKKWLSDATKYATILLGDEIELKLELPKAGKSGLFKAETTTTSQGSE